MSDAFNLSMRKFLKQVGVTSQQAIEGALRDAGPDKTAGKSFKVTVVLQIEDLNLDHHVEGTITDRPDEV